MLIVGEIKIWPFKKIEVNIPSERAFSKLSEYLKIIATGLTEQKLWPVKDTHQVRRYMYCTCTVRAANSELSYCICTEFGPGCSQR